MPTLKDMQEQLRTAEFQKLVFEHLVDYLDTTFRPVGGKPAGKVLMNQDRIPVPDSIFETVSSTLATQAAGLATWVTNIQESQVTVGTPAATTDKPVEPKQGASK